MIDKLTIAAYATIAFEVVGFALVGHAYGALAQVGFVLVTCIPAGLIIDAGDAAMKKAA